MPHSRYPKEIILKDGKEIQFKTVEPVDNDALVHFYRSQDQAFKWYLKEDPCDPQVIQKWIESQKEGKSFSIVSIYADQIVGHGSLLFRPYGARKHIGRLRILVAPDFRRVQLGTWMIFDLTKRAMEVGIERLRMDFVVGIDDFAIEGVRKLDFVKEGLLKDYIQDEYGNYHDYQIMVKQLHQEWSDF